MADGSRREMAREIDGNDVAPQLIVGVDLSDDSDQPNRVRSAIASAKISTMATTRELRWATLYNGYEKFADEPAALLRVLQPAMSEYDATGRVPEWCGVDFLRAWAFYRQREVYFAGGGEPHRDWEAVLEALRRHPAATGNDLPPDNLPDELPRDWAVKMSRTLSESYWDELMDFVYFERREYDVVPRREQMFRAFELTRYDAVRVVILGQDPYPKPGDADGLAFSVSNPKSKTPASLRNIFTELSTDLGLPMPTSNSLTGWAEQGVLLLNTALTLRAGSKADRAVHRNWNWFGHGWTTFTDAVASAVSTKEDPVVFLLWGNDARQKAPYIDDRRHLIVESSHPSPFSAAKGFFGSKPFSHANQFLGERRSIDWAKNA